MKKKPPINHIIVVVAQMAGPGPEIWIWRKGDYWQPVAGGVSLGDRRKKKPLLAAARRELKKETGLPAGKLIALGVVHRDDGGEEKHARAYLKIVKPGTMIGISDEHNGCLREPPERAEEALAHSPRFARALQLALKKLQK